MSDFKKTRLLVLGCRPECRKGYKKFGWGGRRGGGRRGFESLGLLAGGRLCLTAGYWLGLIGTVTGTWGLDNTPSCGVISNQGTRHLPPLPYVGGGVCHLDPNEQQLTGVCSRRRSLQNRWIFDQDEMFSSLPARLGKGQGAEEIGHNLARERPKF